MTGNFIFGRAWLAIGWLWLLLLAAARPALAQVPPGNALAFDGTNDYVALPNTTAVPTGNGTYTLEAWIKPNAMGVYGIIGWGNWGVTNQVNALRLSPSGIVNYWWGPDLIVTTPDLSGHWHHVAATFDGTTRTIYLDGVAVGSDAPGSHTVPSPSNLRIGCTNGPSPGGGYEYFNGSIDEVRIWNVARSATQIKAAYTNWPAAPQTGLVAAYSCNQGTAGGSNAGLTNLADQSGNTNSGTLTGFALSGGTSNWVESYALVVPTLTAATGVTGTGFTVNWTAPAVGTVSNYVLDYATSPTFATLAGTFSPAAGATSQALSGLLFNTTYYYRLRADKAGNVTGQGAYATGTVRTPSVLTPPGNALAFYGDDDYVAVGSPAALSNLGLGALTMESWVYCTNLPGVNSIIRKGGDYNLVLLDGGILYAEVWSAGTGSSTRVTARTQAPIEASRWTHVAATWNGSALRLYVNGALVPFAQTSSPVSTSEQLRIGQSAVFNQPFSGRLDEVRLYSAALTAAQLQADMASTSAAVPASLLLYYNFDQGTAGGNNVAVTTLTDQSATLADGTLTGFNLTSGNNTSNWVGSAALVVPTLAAATGGTGTGFTANWLAPLVGTAGNGYLLDVATSRSFAATALVAGSPLSTTGTSQAVTGLDPAQTYYYRVRTDPGAPAGQGAASAVGTWGPTVPMSPPGNALAFDGSDDFVAGRSEALPQGNAPRTLEAWVLTTQTSSGVIFNYGTASSNLRSALLVIGGKLYYAGEFNDLAGTRALNDGHWHHVAATYDGTTLKLYVDGVLDVSNTMAAFNTTGSTFRVGSRIFADFTSLQEQFNGRLDEVRVYSTALTQAQVQADMTSTSPAVPGSQMLYYNFDQGTAGGANAGYTTAADRSASQADGTLTGFNLGSSTTTSNWVESYALLVPTGLTASATSTTLSAAWTAPTVNGAAPAAGKVEGYGLEVATNAAFTAPVTGSPFSVAAPATSQVVSGLANGTTYYLRVRAEKANVTGQGAYSAPATTHTIGTDAFLTNLTASAGTLSPAFASATTAYTLPLPVGSNTFTLTPTASNAYTTLTANGVAVASGAATVSYPAGTLVTLVLTSEDGQATRTYTLQSVKTPAYYRSVASGNWGDAGTWEGSDDNVTWGPVPYGPSASLQPTVSIRAGHTVTVAAFVQVNRTTVQSGGTLTIAPGTTLECLNTGAGADLTVAGALTVPATAVLLMGRLSGTNGYTGTSQTTGFMTVQSGGTFTADGIVLLNSGGIPNTLAAGTSTFNAGSRVMLFATVGTLVVPLATWAPTATLELGGDGSNSNVSGSFGGKTFGNVDITFTGAGTHLLLTAAGAATVAGNLTVTRAAGTGALRLISAGTTATLTVQGSYVQNSGAVTGYLSTTTTGNGPAPGVSVGGNFQLLGGTYTAMQIASATTTTIRPTPLAVAGNLSIGSGATFYLVSGAAPTTNYISGVTLAGDFTNSGTFSTLSTVAANTNQQLYFTKSGVQSFTNTGTIGTGTTNRVNVTVNAGSTLDMGTSALTGTGTFATVAGATLRLGSPTGLSGNVQSTGTRTYNGSFEFNGAAAQGTGTGFPSPLAATTTLTFNNPAGVTLGQALTVPGTFSLRQGPVTTTATNLLTLGSSGTVLGTLDATATNTGYVVGPLKRWVAAATGSTVFPVGTGVVARPASISYTVAPTTAGTLTAEFVPTDSGSNGLPLTEGSITVSKAAEPGFWRVSAADRLAGGTYSPSFTYTSLTGTISRYYAELVLLKRVDSASPWTLPGTHATTSGSRAAPVLSRTGLTGFSEFTAGGDGSGPLPVELVRFEARLQGGAVALSWATASEKNSARFEVERSLSGTSFERIGTVAAAGTSTAPHSYELLDNQVPKSLSPQASIYYRLKQVDADGTFSYSPVRSVRRSEAAEGLALFPNPATTGATLTGALPGTVVMVFDALGRPVLSATADAAGSAALVLPAGLASGVYVVRTGRQALRLTVE